MSVVANVKNLLGGGKAKAVADLADVPAPLRLESFPDWERLAQQRQAVQQRLDAAERRIVSLSQQLTRHDDARAFLHGEDDAAIGRELAAARRERGLALEALAIANREERQLLRRLARPAVEPMLSWFRGLSEAIGRKLLELAELAALERQALGLVCDAGLGDSALMSHGPATPAFCGVDLANHLRWMIEVQYLPANAVWRSALANLEGSK